MSEETKSRKATSGVFHVVVTSRPGAAIAVGSVKLSESAKKSLSNTRENLESVAKEAKSIGRN